MRGMFVRFIYRQWFTILQHHKRCRVSNLFTHLLPQHQFSWLYIFIGMFRHIQLRQLFIWYMQRNIMYNRLLCIINNRMYTCWHWVLFCKWFNNTYCMYEQTRKFILYRLGRRFKRMWLGM